MKTSAVLFDWAGTIVDFGSKAPELALKDTFLDYGIRFSGAEIQQFMGVNKLDHVRNLIELPGICQMVSNRPEFHGREKEEMIQEIYEHFNKRLKERLSREPQMIPGAEALITALHEKGIRTGSSTGYTREMLDLIVDQLSSNRSIPQVHVSCSEVKNGRPSPDMLNLLLEKLGIEDRSTVISVGDTKADIEAAKNAGVCAVGVVVGSSMLNLSELEIENLSEAERIERIEEASAVFRDAGADHVIDRIGDLLSLVAQ